MQKDKLASGFTIIELLVVIVVIGILAAITAISYSGVRQKAVEVSLQSDLSNASKQIKMHEVDYDQYPSTIDCGVSNSATNLCIRSSSNNTDYEYTANNATNPPTFSLDAIDEPSSTRYRITHNSSPTQVSFITCPTGYIVVPGSVTYGTSDFCVMKYEAKNVGGVAVSQVDGTVWVSINRMDAETASEAICASCHLITEAEWLTIVQNVLSVPSNWYGGVVGTNYIYRGHSDNSPGSALAASTDDVNGGYYLTGNSESSGPEQRRTLTLTNDEVIWDLSGNVAEWTQGDIGANQQPGLLGESVYSWKQWNNVSLNQHGLPDIAMPAYAGASGWGSDQGIGQLYSMYTETIEKAIIRGGNWSNGVDAGVLSLYLFRTYAGGGAGTGFRVTRS